MRQSVIRTTLQINLGISIAIILGALPLPSCAARSQNQLLEEKATQSDPPSLVLKRGRESEKPQIQIGDYPSAAFEDRHGHLWFRAVGEGVIHYDGKEFTTYSTKDGLGGNIIRGILEDAHGVLWFATSGGLSSFDGEVFTTYTKYEEFEGKDFAPGLSGNGDHLDLWDLIVDRHGVFWIATLDGIFQFDGEIFHRFHLPAMDTQHSHEFTPKMAYCIFEDQDGALWFGTDGAGAVRYDGKEQVVFTTDHGLCSNHVSSIIRDPRGFLWFGTSGGGVSQYDGSSFTTHLQYPTFQEHGVGWGRFLALFVDRAGFVWFGVSGPGGGVYRHDGDSFRYFSEKEGLGVGGVFSIREDRSGTLWLGTTSGVFWFDGENFINFTRDP
jgi:ligand-binding sensor domain-containing protein